MLTKSKSMNQQQFLAYKKKLLRKSKLSHFSQEIQFGRQGSGSDSSDQMMDATTQASSAKNYDSPVKRHRGYNALEPVNNFHHLPYKFAF